jgi:4-amino-4-deoxy-L-arabinose transferase-like glycosyltransferase
VFEKQSPKMMLPILSGWRARPLLLILTAAFAIRVLWALAVPVMPVSDSAAYLELAQSVAAGRGFAWANGAMTAFWPPGTSFVYGAVFWLFGDGYGPIVLVVFLAYRAACALYGEAVALWTAGILAVWPVMIQFTTIMASEILFLVPVLAALVLVYECKHPRWWHFVGFGLLVAAASYVRPTAIPLIVLIPLLAAFRAPSVRHLLGWIGLGGLVCALAIWPWSERNTRLFGQPTGISTNFGANLWMGNNSQSQGTYQNFDQYIHIANEKSRDDQMKSDAITFITEHPSQFLVLAVRRIVNTFDRETIGVVWNVEGLQKRFGQSGLVEGGLKLASTAYWYLVLLLAVAGAWLIARREGWRVICNPMVLIALFFAAVPAVIVGQDRYHMPLIPMLACFAAYSSNHWCRRSNSLKGLGCSSPTGS